MASPPPAAVPIEPLDAATRRPPSWFVRALLVWLVLSVMLVGAAWPLIAQTRFGDPDDALRLLEVRDWLSGQSWFDVHQYRVAPPAGVAMHWSRLVDVPIAALIVALRPWLGSALAEHITLVAVPLLTLLCAVLLVARLAARRFDVEVAGIACLVLGVASPVLFQMSPLRIDHHGWQIVLALVALTGLCSDDERQGGAIMGISLAALLAISIEGLPLTAAFLGVLALRGLRRPLATARTRFSGAAAASAALALTSLALFLLTRGTGDLVTHCDQISPVHLVLFAWVGIGLVGLNRAGTRAPLASIMVLGVVGIGALAILWGGAPQCRSGAFAALDPLVRQYWYVGVAEGMPFWKSPVIIATTTVGVPLVGLFACFIHWRDSRNPRAGEFWLDYGLILLAAWAIGLMVARASATACAFAAVPTAALVLQWIISLRTARLSGQVIGYLGVALVLLPAMPVVAWNAVRPAHGGPSQTVALKQSQCNYPQVARALDAMPPTDIFAPLDIGPDLLVRSHHRVVATGHHRGTAGMHDVIAAFLGSADQARTIIARRHATLLVVCPDIAEPATYAHYAPDGLMAQLLQNRAPAWLRPANLAPGSHVLIWRVVDPAAVRGDKAR